MHQVQSPCNSPNLHRVLSSGVHARPDASYKLYIHAAWSVGRVGGVGATRLLALTDNGTWTNMAIEVGVRVSAPSEGMGACV
jgi:hypothetical protein